MDSLASSIASSAIVSTPIFYGKRAWPGGPSIQQNWLLPESIIFYAAKNPSSAAVYFKLIQSCKYFFERNPILIVTKFDTCPDNVNCYICQNSYKDCIENKRKCCIKIDMKKLSSKLWITLDLCLQYGTQNFTSLLCSKLYHSEIYCLGIRDKIIQFDDFKVLTTSANAVFSWKCSIIYSDGKIVMLDKILKCLPNLGNFLFKFGSDISMVNDTTMENIIKLQNLKNLKFFALEEIPEALAVEYLSALLNKLEDTHIFFDFNDNISEEYKNRLDALIDDVIELGVPNRLIEYDGQDLEKYQIMKRRYTSSDNENDDMNDDDEMEDSDNEDDDAAEDSDDDDMEHDDESIDDSDMNEDDDIDESEDFNMEDDENVNSDGVE
uniref:Uncharacterized protein n=1 Tax=Panagrolaimus davidi TaxID=227884 RepID=A0A914Q7T8_9BILA